ncbi:MAG: DUF2474 family protein [Sphingomicrobium sp.]
MSRPPHDIDDGSDPRWWVRFAWLAGIWAASVAALALVAGLIRWWLH